MPLDGVCSLCKNPKATEEPKGGSAIVTCPQCGRYSITDVAMLLKDQIKVPRHLLSGVVRNYWETTCKPYNVCNDFTASMDDFKRLAPVAIPSGTDIPAKADYVFRHICRKSCHPGIVVRVSGRNDFVIGFCQNYDELHFCLCFLEKQGLIESVKYESNADACCRVSATGWAYLSGVGTDSKDQGFIAMAFCLATSDLLHTAGLNPGIESAGYKPQRIDRKEHNNRIDDEIVAEIRKSKFVVADLTGKNAGAYFEAGFAMGLGKPVIWTCQQSEIDAGNVHFDTRQYSIVSWEPDKLDIFATRLTQRIEATIGRGRYLAEAVKSDKE